MRNTIITGNCDSPATSNNLNCTLPPRKCMQQQTWCHKYQSTFVYLLPVISSSLSIVFMFLFSSAVNHEHPVIGSIRESLYYCLSLLKTPAAVLVLTSAKGLNARTWEVKCNLRRRGGRVEIIIAVPWNVPLLLLNSWGKQMANGHIELSVKEWIVVQILLRDCLFYGS